MVVGEVGGERAFDGFVIAKGPIELVGQRQCRRGFILACCDALHLGEDLFDAGAAFREMLGQRVPGAVEIVGKYQWRAQRPAAHFVKDIGGNPFHRIEHAGALENLVLGVARVLRIAGFVQRAFDKQVADLVARGRAADRVAALDDQHLAAGSRENCRSGEPAKARADHHHVETRHLSETTSIRTYRGPSAVP